MFLAHYRSQRANRTNESPVAPIREFESAFNANLKGGDKMSREDLSFDEVENEIFEYGASHAGDDAIKEYQEALRINPEHGEAHFSLGIVFHKKGLFNEAISEYRDALKIVPGSADVHTNLGAALADMGFHNEAIKEFQEALRINPEDLIAQKNLEVSLRDNVLKAKGDGGYFTLIN